jgi:hypothetical protein
MINDLENQIEGAREYAERQWQKSLQTMEISEGMESYESGTMCFKAGKIAILEVSDDSQGSEAQDADMSAGGVFREDEYPAAG